MKTPELLSRLCAFTLAICALPALAQQTQGLLTKHVPLQVASREASTIGRMDQSLRLRLDIVLPLRNEDSLDGLLSELQDPKSSNYHKYLSSEQFTERFAASVQDYNAITEWAKSKSLDIVATPSNRRLITVSGSTASINAAFNIALTTYFDPAKARQFYAPDREPTVDAPIQILAVSGLDNANPPRTHLVRPAKSQESPQTEVSGLPSYTYGSGPNNTYLPSDMRAAYYGSGPLTGAGQTVAVFSYEPYSPSDLQFYYQQLGIAPNVPVTAVSVNGFNALCSSTCSDGEQIIDIANVIGMAPGLSAVRFYAGSSSASVLNQMASDDDASVISNSWYNGDFGTASDTYFKTFQAQGQTFVSASGDYGDFQDTSNYGPPELDPYITQVGGTDLNTGSRGGNWSSEVAWSPGNASCPRGGSGGGWITNTYAIPAYQQLAGVIDAANLGSTTWRNSPDVAAEGGLLQFAR